MARSHAEDVLELPKVLSILGSHCQIVATRQMVSNYQPFRTMEQVERELDRVTEIKKLGITVQLGIPAEPGHLGQKLQTTSFLSCEALTQLKHWFILVRDLIKHIPRDILQQHFQKFGKYDDIESEINRILDDKGSIRDDASSNLKTIRKRQKRLHQSIQRTLQDLLSERSSVFSDATIVERNGHYVLPVKRNFRKDLSGVVHAYSNSGETVFIEPLPVTEDAAQLVELAVQEQEEIEQILRNITDTLRPYIETIEQDIETIIDLDIVLAKIRYAQELGGVRPLFAKNIVIKKGFHPILRIVNENVVPLDVRIDPGKSILLISGPNAGGKTIALKTVGIITLMAKCGMYIPVEEGSMLPFFEEVYADIGDEQSIESQMSTFAAHLKQIQDALQAGPQSLILFDELMSQTSVDEGSALAIAILESFAEKGCVVFATTHNENLKLYASTRLDMLNAGMEYTDHPTYRLILGIPQPSNAIRLAQRSGINHGVIDRARSYMDQDKLGLNELFEDLSKQLKAVEMERNRLSDLVNKYETKLAGFNTKRKTVLDELKARYKKDLIQSKRSIEKLIKDLKKQGATSEKVSEVRTFFDTKLKLEEKHEPYHPAIGEIVYVRELKKNGQVIEEHAGKYKVSLDTIFYWVDPEDIEAAKEDQGNQ